MAELLKDFRGLKERLTVDTSEDQPVYLLAGKNGSYIRLSPSAYQLLQLCSSGISFEAIAEELSQQMAQDVSSDDVRAAYEHVVERIEEIEKNTSHPRPGFLVRFSLIPQKLVTFIASGLSIAFHPIVAAGLLVFIVVSIVPAIQSMSPDFAPQSFWLGYALLIASTLMHEFGHASACARYGAQPSDIGFTIYYIYPTFYSDVSAAWTLGRWQRVVVDLGGAFFQLAVGAGYALGYKLFAWEPLKAAFLMILGNLVFSLNPIFRFDGYWVIADALGVTNLGQQPSRIFKHFLARLRGQPTKPLPWPKLVQIILLPYTLFSFGFWGFFVWRIVPFIWHQVRTYPSAVGALITDLFDPSRTVALDSVRSLLMSTYMVVIALIMVWRMGSPVLRAVKSKIPKQPNRQHAETSG